MNWEEFQKQRLTADDLRDYESLLGEAYKKYLNRNNKLLDYKEIILQGQGSAKEYERLKKSMHHAKDNYKKILKNSVFKTNYRQVRWVWVISRKKNIHFKDIQAEYQRAKKLYKKSKIIISQKGQNAIVVPLNDIAIAVDNLSFRYNTNAPLVLKNVSFAIPVGSYVAIVGHNGSGKSTLAKILMGVLNFHQGTIYFFGNKVTPESITQLRQFLSIVFQNPDNQFIGSTVQSDIAFGLENRNVPPKKMPKIIRQAAKQVGMEKFLDTEPLNLSGGQKQRVAIASAVALKPKIIIFDEATSMLDPRGKKEIKQIMVDLVKEQNTTVVSITHDMDEILNADQVIVMNQGTVQKIGTPEEIVHNHEFLKTMHLQRPFIYEVQAQLKNQGISFPSKAKNIKELAELLWND